MKLSKKALTAMIAVSIVATTISATSIVQKMAQTSLEQEVSMSASQETMTLQTDTVSEEAEQKAGEADVAPAVQETVQEESSKEESLEGSKPLDEVSESAYVEANSLTENAAGQATESLAEETTREPNDEPGQELSEESLEESAEDEILIASVMTAPDLKATDEPFEYEEYSCKDANGTVKEGVAITGITVSGDIIIPAEIDGKPVLAIKGSEFGKPVSGLENAKSIDFSGASNLSVIGAYAFYECENISGELNLPNVVTIENRAFFGCKNITSVNLPSCKTIGLYAFANCKDLGGDVDIKSCEYLGQKAFANTGIKTIDISGCEFVGDSAFDGCEELTAVTWNVSLCKIPNYCFSGCKNLTSVNNGQTEGLDLSFATKIGEGAFYSCKSIEGDLNLSNCLHVGDYAFEYCKKINGTVDLRNCQYIGTNAFVDSKCKPMLFTKCRMLPLRL